VLEIVGIGNESDQSFGNKAKGPSGLFARWRKRVLIKRPSGWRVVFLGRRL